MHNIALAVAEAHQAAHAASGGDPEKALPYIIVGLIIFRIGLSVFGRRSP